MNVKQQRTSFLQVGKAVLKRCQAFISPSSQIESVAYVNGPVPAWEVKFVHGLLVKVWIQSLADRLVAAIAQHIA